MKKILILGASGMFGHIAYKYFLSLNKYEIYTTTRNSRYINPHYYIDIEKELEKLKDIIEYKKFDVIINCIGILFLFNKSWYFHSSSLNTVNTTFFSCVYVRLPIMPLHLGLFIHVLIAACASNRVFPAPTAPL